MTGDEAPSTVDNVTLSTTPPCDALGHVDSSGRRARFQTTVTLGR